MEINAHNYEQYAMDYLEGNLSGAKRAAFERFLQANPSIANELTGLHEARLSDDDPPTLSSGNLKVPAGGDWDEKLIAYHEGLLTDAGADEVRSAVEKHPALKADYELYGKSYLEADQTVNFPGKRALYKRSGVVITITRATWWAAAAVLLALALWWFNQPEGVENQADRQNQVVENTGSPSENLGKPNDTEGSSKSETENQVAQSSSPKKQRNEKHRQNNSTATPAKQDGHQVEKPPKTQTPSGQKSGKAEENILPHETTRLTPVASIEPAQVELPKGSLALPAHESEVKPAQRLAYGESEKSNYQDFGAWLAGRGKALIGNTHKKQDNSPDSFIEFSKEEKAQSKSVSVKVGFLEVEHTSSR